MEIEPDDLCILSGDIELENHLTMDDIHDYDLAWDYEEREDNQRVIHEKFIRFNREIKYPVFYYRLIAEPNSEESNASSEGE